MMIRVTGRFELMGKSGTVNVSGRIQRALLALLTIRRNSWMPSEALVDALWAGEAPQGLETRLHLQIHRLRRRLGMETIERGPDGYRLVVEDDAVDVWRFEELVAGVLAASADGIPTCETLQRLDDGIAQWGGDPFPDVEHPDVVAERHRLQEIYLAAQESRAEQLIGLGEDRGALDAITSVAIEHPTREHLQALRMSALHRLGRRTQVLNVFRTTRDALGEMGLEPGEELLALRAQLKEDTVRFEAANTTGSRGVGSGEPLTAVLTPREQELRRALSDHRQGEDDNAQRRELAMLLAGRGALDESLGLLGHAEAHHRVYGEDDARASVLRDMAAVVSIVGDQQRALRLLAEAAELRERTTGTDTMLQIVRALVLAHLGRLEEAQQWLDVAGPPSTGAPTGQVAAARRAPFDTRVHHRDEMWWRVRSQIDRRRGAATDAVRGSREAYRHAQQDPVFDAAPVRVELAAALRDAGDPECFTVYREAIEDARETGRLPLAAYAHASAAKAWLAWDDPHRAAAHASTGLNLARRCGCWIFAARAASRIADAQEQLGRAHSAGWYRREALSFYRRVDHPLPAVQERLEDLLARERAIPATRRS